MKSLPNLTPLAGTPGSPQLMTAEINRNEAVRVHETEAVMDHKERNEKGVCLGYVEQKQKKCDRNRLAHHDFVLHLFVFNRAGNQCHLFRMK